MLSTCAAERENLIFIMHIKNMRKIPDILKVFFFEKNCFHCDRFACFDHFLQFLSGSGCNYPSVIHNCDAGTDLFYFLHVVGSINDSGTLFVQFLDTFENFITALRSNCNGRLIHNAQTRLVSDTASNIQPSQQTARKFPGAGFTVIFEPDKLNCLIDQFFAAFFIRNI